MLRLTHSSDAGLERLIGYAEHPWEQPPFNMSQPHVNKEQISATLFHGIFGDLLKALPSFLQESDFSIRTEQNGDRAGLREFSQNDHQKYRNGDREKHPRHPPYRSPNRQRDDNHER